MPGCCNYIAAITFLLLLVVQTLHVESKNLRIQKRFTREDVCKETVKTSKTVYDCPVDVASVRKRSQEANCENIHDSCSKESLVYHCVRSGNKLIEVCAPRNFITGKCCAQFNEGVGRIVEDYSVSCSECPFHYYSNESITYPTCFKVLRSMVVQQSTVQSTAELTSKSTSTPEPAPEAKSYFSTASPNTRKKCRSATGRRKRNINKNCEDDTTTTVYVIHLNETSEAGNSYTSDMDDGDFTVVFVTLTVMGMIGIGASYFAFKGIIKPTLICKKNKDGEVDSQSSNESSILHDLCDVRATDDDTVPDLQTKASLLKKGSIKPHETWPIALNQNNGPI